MKTKKDEKDEKEKGGKQETRQRILIMFEEEHLLTGGTSLLVPVKDNGPQWALGENQQFRS